MRPEPLPSHASTATWASLAFLAGLIIGLASCTPEQHHPYSPTTHMEGR
jgi:hypothetical protein